MGSAAADLVGNGQFGVMVAVAGDAIRAVPLSDVAGKRRTVPLDHPLVAAVEHLGTCLGR